MADLVFEVRVEAFARDMAQYREIAPKVVQLATLEAWRNIRIEAPVDHGRLAGSFQIEGGALEQHIVSGVDYAFYVHEGHGEIVPKTAKVLRFQPKGSREYVFARRVGPVERNPYAERALKATEGRVGEFARMAIGGSLA